jgi:hypothetical protein
MAFVTEDRVQETSTTTGTGDFTLAGAVAGFRAFSAVCSVSDTVPYTIEAVDGSGIPTGEFETGVGTYSASNTLTRTTVFESSNAGAAVNFSAGTKRVFIAMPGRFVQPYLIGSVATTSGTSAAFTSIPQYYNTLHAVFKGVSHDDGSARAFRFETSDDNGSSWSAARSSGSHSASVTIYGGLWLPRYTGTAGVGLFQPDAISGPPSTGNTGVHVPWRATAGINGLRFSFAAGNLDAGSIDLWGIG